jgi:hypothetical protein
VKDRERKGTGGVREVRLKGGRLSVLRGKGKGRDRRDREDTESGGMGKGSEGDCDSSYDWIAPATTHSAYNVSLLSF